MRAGRAALGAETNLAVLIGLVHRRLSTLSLLSGGRLPLHLLLSVLGRCCYISCCTVHRARWRMLSIVRCGTADSLAGMTRRRARTSVLGGLASVAGTGMRCCNTQE